MNLQKRRSFRNFEVVNDKISESLRKCEGIISAKSNQKAMIKLLRKKTW